MFTVEIDDSKLRLKLNAMPDKLRAALKTKTTQLALILEGKVKAKLSNDVLHVRSGDLRRSIFHKVEANETTVEGSVGSSSDVKYGRIHEYGGTINIPEIVASKAKALHFVMGGKDVFAKSVRAHTITIPARPFLRPSLAEMREQIVTGYKQTILDTLTK